MEQQRQQKSAQQPQEEGEEIQHGPLPIEQLQVTDSLNGFLQNPFFFIFSPTHFP